MVVFVCATICAFVHAEAGQDDPDVLLQKAPHLGDCTTGGIPRPCSPRPSNCTPRAAIIAMFAETQAQKSDGTSGIPRPWKMVPAVIPLWMFLL